MACSLVHRAWMDLEATADARYEQPDDPVLYLARGVIAQACREWRSGRYVYVKEQPRPETVAGELLEFFKSPVFVVWCDIADIDADYLRERLGVSECK